VGEDEMDDLSPLERDNLSKNFADLLRLSDPFDLKFRLNEIM
jgi:hypothetical protein